MEEKLWNFMKEQKYEYKFTDTEDMIIEYMRKNKEEIVKLSIQSLADKFLLSQIP